MLPWYLAPPEEPLTSRGGAGIRFGNVVFRDRDFATWLSPYVTGGAGYKPNIAETLAFANVALLGRTPQTNVSTDLLALVDSLEGTTLADFDSDTTGTLLVEHELDKVRFALVFAAREVPPMACLPFQERDADHQATGDPVQKATVWNQEPRISVTAGPVGLQVWGPDGDDTNYSTVRTSIPGWTETEFNEQIDNEETDGDQTDAYRLFYDNVEMAKARPWWGWFFIHGLPDTAGSNVSVDASIGREHYRAFTSGGTAWFSHAGNTLGWTDLDTGISAEWVCVRVVKTGITRLILLWVEDAGAIKVYESTDNGGTWSVATTLSSGSDNSKPFASVTLSRLRYVYWIKGSDPYAVYVAIVDNAGNVVTTETATTGIGAVDDAGGGSTISSVPQTGGEERIVLEVIQSGAVVTYTSTDGIAFS